MQPDIPRLIGKIRDAGLSPDAWPDALKSLTDALGIAGASCIISNTTTGRVDWVCFSGLSAEFQSAYINHYAPLDPYTPLLNVDLGWTKLSESLPDTVLRKSEWYNDFVLSCGVSDILGARVVETPSHFVTFGLHQQIGRRFGDNTAAIMQVVSRPLSLATLRHVESISNSPRGEQNSKISTRERDIISMCEMAGNIRTKWGEPLRRLRTRRHMQRCSQASLRKTEIGTAI